MSVAQIRQAQGVSEPASNARPVETDGTLASGKDWGGPSAMTERKAPPEVADADMSPATSGARTFSQWLKVQLRARKLTQRQLAQRSGVDHSTISRLVRGNRIPSLRTANLLAYSLGITAGLDGVERQGLGSTASPAARVEYALRLDDLLSERQVREIMNVYLATRLRRPRGLATPVAGLRPRSTSSG